MKKSTNNRLTFGSIKVTKLILYGSLGLAIGLTSLLIIYDISTYGSLRERTYIGLLIILYLGVVYYFLHKKYLLTVNITLITLYGALAFTTLLFWGLNSAIGIFATSFVIILAGILIGSRSIFPVAIGIIALLCVVQIIHGLGIVTPNTKALSERSSFFDVLTYATVLSIFSLITWISDSQMERSLKRATEAELTIRSQKESISKELEKESFRLRQIQLKEVQQLYRFATLGQSTAATLHELSNHLSILNMDIEDLKQQNKNSKAIENAKDGIEQINLMVHQVRRKLDSFDTQKNFNSISYIKKAIKDEQQKFKLKRVFLKWLHSGQNTFQIKGDPLALMQVITILLNNALDACYKLPNPKVIIKTECSKSSLKISVIDNGVGINDEIRRNLFSPILSNKPSGLGVGLYIAKHLIETQFHGSIILNETDELLQKTEFKILIPIRKIKG